MLNIDNNPQLHERIWQAWIQKNAAQDQVRFRRRLKVIGLVLLCLALSALLFEIHKVSADVLQLRPMRPMPGFRSKTVLGGSSIARMQFVPPSVLLECPCPPLCFGSTPHRFHLDHEPDNAALDPPERLRQSAVRSKPPSDVRWY
jgi:hypothetical protein